MAEKRRGLGKSLDLLLNTVKQTNSDLSVAAENTELRYLSVKLLQRGKYQPRKELAPENLQELANSIAAQGILQPIVVRHVDHERYEIIAGERRWRAAQLAGLSEVPAIIRDVPNEAAIAMALIENIQRENLNAWEEAQALQHLLEEFRLSHQQIADAIGKSRTTVTNLLRLMQLHPQLQKHLAEKALEKGHAIVLLALDSHLQPQAARQVIDKQLSVRETERLVKQLLEGRHIKPEASVSADIQQAQQSLTEQLGAKVVIKHHGTGKGSLTIRYNNLAKLKAILARIH